ncbi:MAG: tRNA-dihydrouridine synthase family protein [Clostridia bacterium]|nr:tRNA-dihydrouridine synthase family protein [Clostridia bacterium]
MKLYFAPLEGVTDVYFRRIHADLFGTSPMGKADEYFAPFLSITQDLKIHERDLHALAKEKNAGMHVVPQIMTNRADAFLSAARQLWDLGYDEVNLNLGCPSGTVVGKNRGAGFLSEPDMLDRFFYTVFSDPLFTSTEMRLSVKSRLGMVDPDEFKDILEIYNRYPISELILHPRVRKEMYKGDVHTDMTAYTSEHTTIPLCCNGDLFTVRDVDHLFRALPKEPHALMFGRGAVSNPNLFLEVRQYLAKETVTPLTKEQLWQFSDALCRDAQTRLSGAAYAVPFKGALGILDRIVCRCRALPKTSA